MAAKLDEAQQAAKDILAAKAAHVLAATTPKNVVAKA